MAPSFGAPALNRHDEAIARARAGLDVAPWHPGLHYNLGVALQEAGDLEGARAAFTEAVALKPDFVQAWNNLGLAFEDGGRDEEALAAFSRAMELQPAYLAALRNLGRLALRVGEASFARSGLRELVGLEPKNCRARFGAALALPAVPASVEAIDAARADFAEGLAELTELAESGGMSDPACLLALQRHTNFYLAYQGHDDRALQSRYARLVRLLVAGQVQECSPNLSLRDEGPLRVAFASSFLRDCTIGHYFGSWLTDLDPDRFEISVFLLGHIEDGMTARLTAGARRVVRADDAMPLADVARRIRDASPDVLVYPELGMDGRAYALAALRLAPVQCVAWGHPVTSGLPTIDYFLSCAIMEPPDADGHYTEKLIRFPGLGTRYLPPLEVQRLARTDFGLPESAHLYLLPHPPYKMHPEEDGRLAEILAADPDGILVFCAGVEPAMNRQLFRRLAPVLARRNLGMDRLCLLPHQTRPRYLALNRLCDVLLDTSGWSGGNTTLDALVAGLPVVTRPGRFMRGRQTAGMLELMNLMDLIVADDHDYVRRAVAIASDVHLREAWSARIAGARARVFDDPGPVVAWQDWLLSLRGLR